MLNQIMKEYLDANSKNDVHLLLEEAILSVPTSNPIQPKDPRNDWEVINDPQRLIKEYTFSAGRGLIDFVNEILLYQEEVGHHAKLTVEDTKVTIEVYTHGIESITELDSEYARTSDDIYRDVATYSAEEGNV